MTAAVTCATNCRLCRRFVISQDVTFADGNLVINLPAGTYANAEKYCIVVAQTIPATTTIYAPVYVTIGTGTELYPLTRCDCAQVTACGIRTRTRYSVTVSTTPTGASFKMLGRPACAPDNRLAGVDGTAPDTGGGAAT